MENYFAIENAICELKVMAEMANGFADAHDDAESLKTCIYILVDKIESFGKLAK